MQVLFEPENILYTIIAGEVIALVLGVVIGGFIFRRSYGRAAREEADMNRAVFEQVAEGIFVYDYETKSITEVNPSFCASLGYEAQELRGRAIYDLVSDSRESIDENARKIVEMERYAVGERMYRRKDGSFASFDVVASRVYNAGRIVICVVARDVSESRENEKRLREAEDLYRTLVEQIPAIVYIEDFETEATLYDSPQIEKILGYPADTYENDPYYWEGILHPDDRERVMRVGKERMQDESCLVEYRVKSKDGAVVWLRDESWLMKDDEGNPRFWRGVIFDITDMKGNEEDLRETEERYRSLVRISPGVVLVQREGRIVAVSDPGEDVLGPEEALIGRPVLGFVHQDDRRAVRNVMRLVDRGETPDSVELKMTRSDGETIDAVFAASPVRYRGEPAAQVVVRDVTEQRATEREADRQRAELVRSNAELERFAYMVASDLQLPLKELSDLSATLLGRGGPRSDEDREYLLRIDDSARRLERMISELLGLSRLTRLPMNREEVDLSEIARSVTSQLRSRDPERRVEIIVAGGLNAGGDRELLETAIHNLMDNAWKFTATSPRPRIVFGMVERDREPVYFVRDNGVGFDMAHAGKLFAPFQTLHSEDGREGAGIGLAAVARVIDRHGGRIWPESEIGKGATFYFTL